MRRDVLHLATAVALAATLASCNARTDQSNNGPSQQTDQANTPAGQQATNPRENPVMPPQTDMPGRAPAAAAPAETQVDLIEYQINMPKTFRAGEQTFTVANAGKEEHSLVIEGNGVKAALPESLKTPGNSSMMRVNLPPGTYTAYCPVPGHKEKGMTTTITVE